MPKIRRKATVLNRKGFEVIARHCPGLSVMRVGTIATALLSTPSAVAKSDAEKKVLSELCSMGLADPKRLGYKIMPED